MFSWPPKGCVLLPRLWLRLYLFKSFTEFYSSLTVDLHQLTSRKYVTIPLTFPFEGKCINTEPPGNLFGKNSFRPGTLAQAGNPRTLEGQDEQIT